MATNMIDYEVLQQAATSYNNEAAAIADVISKLNSVNGVLQQGWQNQTSNAFIERYEREYKKELQDIQNALAEISQYITKYRQTEIERDQSGANSVRG